MTNKMAESVLNDIIESEKKIDESTENAHKKAKQMIIDAEIISRETIEKRKKQIAEEDSKKLENLEKNLEKIKTKKLEEAKKGVTEIKKHANKTSKKAVDYIYEEFLKTIKENA